MRPRADRVRRGVGTGRDQRHRRAQFGGPIAAVSDAGFGFTQNVLQANNNFTVLKGNHAMKAGVDLQWVADTRVSPQAQLYNFPSTQAYLDARSGANRFSYTSFQQYFGLPNLEYNTSQYGLFVQDDWRVSSDLRSLRTALRIQKQHDADPNAPSRRPIVPDVEQKTAPRIGRCGRLVKAPAVLATAPGDVRQT